MNQPLTIEQAFSLAVQHHEAGELETAVGIYQQILTASPGQPDTLNNLSIALKDLGDPEGAVASAKEAIAARRNYPEAHNNLGNALRETGRLKEAAISYRTALKQRSRYAEAHNNLGIVEKSLGRMKEAVISYRKALAIQPRFPEALNNLGNALIALGEVEQAQACFEKALIQKPDYAEAHNNFSNMLREAGDFKAAIKQAEQALTLKPDYAEAHNNLAAAHSLNQRTDLALPHFEKALTLNPQHAESHSNLGNSLTRLGCFDQAMHHYQAALTCDADLERVKNLVNTMLYVPDLPQKTIFEAHQRHINAALPTGIAPLLKPGRLPRLAKGNRLKIGYLSSDLRDHPVGRNVLPLLTHHDPKQVEITVYAQWDADDEIARKFKQAVQRWRPIHALNDQQAAQRIHKDGIHILVFLAPLFDTNRPLIAAYRPAPIQVSFHNGATTGLDAMDYWITDNVLHPEGAVQESFTEQLFRLPVFYNYPPIEDAPDLSPLPLERQGHVTFGSLNNPSKINTQVIDLWAGILNKIPDSRLILKYQDALHDPPVKARILEQFEGLGIHGDRLELICEKDGLSQHLALYQRVDIALDPFPFTGATTTFQALWMGVPVITLLGESFIQRMAADIIIHSGLQELAAENKEQYQSLAVELANAPARLATLRQELRQRLMDSPICDASRYAEHVERAYLEMWQRLDG
ncbi:MAG: tetratricopeptide repeat protein [Magnetococcales bacterium]|nr:tetratricopeptide repeat protein [Magnetococcales bacterium]